MNVSLSTRISDVPYRTSSRLAERHLQSAHPCEAAHFTFGPVWCERPPVIRPNWSRFSLRHRSHLSPMTPLRPGTGIIRSRGQLMVVQNLFHLCCTSSSLSHSMKLSSWTAQVCIANRSCPQCVLGSMSWSTLPRIQAKGSLSILISRQGDD